MIVNRFVVRVEGMMSLAALPISPSKSPLLASITPSLLASSPSRGGDGNGERFSLSPPPSSGSSST